MPTPSAFTPHADLQKSEEQVLAESRQAWRSSFFSVVPAWVCAVLLLAFAAGLWLLADTEQVVVVGDSATVLRLSTKMFLSSVLLGLAPVTLFWVLAQMPPWPTRRRVQRFREFLAVYDAYKAQAMPSTEPGLRASGPPERSVPTPPTSSSA